MFDSVHMQGHVNLNEAAAFEFHSFKVKKNHFISWSRRGCSGK